MSTATLSADIKTRVPASWKKAFEELAEGQFVSAANIQRAALREYLIKRKKLKKEEAV